MNNIKDLGQDVIWNCVATLNNSISRFLWRNKTILIVSQKSQRLSKRYFYLEEVKRLSEPTTSWTEVKTKTVCVLYFLYIAFQVIAIRFLPLPTASALKSYLYEWEVKH